MIYPSGQVTRDYFALRCEISIVHLNLNSFTILLLKRELTIGYLFELFYIIIDLI